MKNRKFQLYLFGHLFFFSATKLPRYSVQVSFEIDSGFVVHTETNNYSEAVALIQPAASELSSVFDKDAFAKVVDNFTGETLAYGDVLLIEKTVVTPVFSGVVRLK